MPNHDDYPSGSRDLVGPAEEHYAITPSDTEDLPRLYRAIYVSVGGAAVIRDKNDTDETYELVAGTFLPFRPVRVLDTGTDSAVRLIGWM